MKKFHFPLVAVLTLAVIFANPVDARRKPDVQPDLWPDGSPIDAWFRDTTTATLADLGKQFVLTDYGVVSDSTILQTTAIQRVIDEAARYASDGRQAVVVVPDGTFLDRIHFLETRREPVCK